MTIGVLGGGQLGRMLALAGYPLGMKFVFFDDSPDACAGDVGELRLLRFADPRESLRGIDVVTYEFENIMDVASEIRSEGTPMFPPVEALIASSDRLLEKQFFVRLGIETPEFVDFQGLDKLEGAARKIGYPCVMKTRRLGYDGKGQTVLKSSDDTFSLEIADKPMIMEKFVEFDRELSIVSVRSRSGDIVFYPLVENHHRDGILRKTIAPAQGLNPETQKVAEGYAVRVLEEFDYVGVLSIELFEKDGRLLANEMAPRVHNSGHWTIEGAETSQFENHLRAITGMPLGSPEPRGPSVMLNLIGGWPEPKDVMAIEGAHLHLYGKEPRPGRKVGHITVIGADALDERIAQITSLM